MSRQCYFLIQEDQWSRAHDVLGVLGLVESVTNALPDGTSMDVRSDDLSALLALAQRDLQCLKSAPGKFLDIDELT